MHRISMVSDVESYLLREHKVLQRPNFNFKDKEFQTAKIILQTVKTIIKIGLGRTGMPKHPYSLNCHLKTKRG